MKRKANLLVPFGNTSIYLLSTFRSVSVLYADRSLLDLALPHFARCVGLMQRMEWEGCRRFQRLDVDQRLDDGVDKLKA